MIHPATPQIPSTVSASEIRPGDYIKNRGFVSRVWPLESVPFIEVRFGQTHVGFYPEDDLVQVLRNN